MRLLCIYALWTIETAYQRGVTKDIPSNSHYNEVIDNPTIVRAIPLPSFWNCLYVNQTAG